MYYNNFAKKTFPFMREKDKTAVLLSLLFYLIISWRIGYAGK